MDSIIHAEHAHKFVFYYIRVLLERNFNEQYPELAQKAWNYANDLYRSVLCLKFRPNVLACASIFLAGRDLKIPLPEPTWWELFDAKQEQVLVRLHRAHARPRPCRPPCTTHEGWGFSLGFRVQCQCGLHMLRALLPCGSVAGQVFEVAMGILGLYKLPKAKYTNVRDEPDKEDAAAGAGPASQGSEKAAGGSGDGVNGSTAGSHVAGEGVAVAAAGESKDGNSVQDTSLEQAIFKASTPGGSAAEKDKSRDSASASRDGGDKEKRDEQRTPPPSDRDRDRDDRRRDGKRDEPRGRDRDRDRDRDRKSRSRSRSRCVPVLPSGSLNVGERIRLP